MIIIIILFHLKRILTIQFKNLRYYAICIWLSLLKLG